VVNIAAIPGITPPNFNLTLTNTSNTTVYWQVDSPPTWIQVPLPGTSGTLYAGTSQVFPLVFNTPLALVQTYFTKLVFRVNGIAALVVPVTLYEATVSQTWYFAEGYTGTGFTEYLTIANPNPTLTTVTVQYLLQGAAPLTRQYQLAANSRFTRNINTEVGAGQSLAMVVTGSQPIIAERPMYFTFASSTWHLSLPGGSDVLGATSLGTDFDFAYLDTTTNHDTYLTILNQDPTTTMQVTVNYFPLTGGTPMVFTHLVNANSRGTIHINDEHLPLGTYSALVHLSLPGLVERPMYLKDSLTGYTGAADVIGVTQPLTDWYFAEGFITPTFTERYILANPSTTQSASGTITFFLDKGQPQTKPFTLAPGQQTILNVASLSISGNNSAHVHVTQPILAERFMSFKFSPTLPGATDVLGAAAPSNLFYFAEGFTGSGFSEYLTIENPDPTQIANVQVTFLPDKPGGQATMQLYSIAPSSRFTLNTGTVMPNQSFSMVLASDAPIVAERPIYFNFNNGQTGGSDVVGYSGFVPPPAPTPPPNGLSVYVGTGDGKVYALNANDGSVRWSYQTGGAIKSSPAVSNGILYIGSTDNSLYALQTSDGSLLWSFKTGRSIEASPLVVNGLVYVSSDDTVFYALNAQTGALVWKYGNPGLNFSQATPTYANGEVYFSTTAVYAADALTGANVRTVGAPPSGYGDLLVVNGVLYVSNGNGIQAFDVSTGTLLYTQNSIFAPSSSPVVVNGILYIGDGTPSYVDALDAATGSILWRTHTGSVIQSKPVIANGILYIGSDDRYVYALKASDGTFLWRSQTGGFLLSYPTVVNGILYIGCEDGGVYAFNTADGSLVWRALTPGLITFSSPAIAP
jgi:outer membrane protein assembly factor BamB